MSVFFDGGAAGYCPRVRQVTYHPSTYIVLFSYYPHGTKNRTNIYCVASRKI